MTRARPQRPTARWPFWLLLAAWFCANSPQAATYEVVVWLGNARHFSHQQRLISEVASILAGSDAHDAIATVSAEPERPFAPPVPADATLKKIDLLFTVSSEWLPFIERVRIETETPFMVPVSPWSEVPAEPPRLA